MCIVPRKQTVHCWLLLVPHLYILVCASASRSALASPAGLFQQDLTDALGLHSGSSSQSLPFPAGQHGTPQSSTRVGALVDSHRTPTELIRGEDSDASGISDPSAIPRRATAQPIDEPVHASNGRADADPPVAPPLLADFCTGGYDNRTGDCVLSRAPNCSAGCEFHSAGTLLVREGVVVQCLRPCYDYSQGGCRISLHFAGGISLSAGVRVIGSTVDLSASAGAIVVSPTARVDASGMGLCGATGRAGFPRNWHSGSEDAGAGHGGYGGSCDGEERRAAVGTPYGDGTQPWRTKPTDPEPVLYGAGSAYTFNPSKVDVKCCGGGYVIINVKPPLANARIKRYGRAAKAHHTLPVDSHETRFLAPSLSPFCRVAALSPFRLPAFPLAISDTLE
eukprot:6175303-Pleurochrysis_carterae.AAC.2